MNLKKIDHQAGDIILTCRQVKSLWKIFGSTTKDDYNAFTYFKDIKIVQAILHDKFFARLLKSFG